MINFSGRFMSFFEPKIKLNVSEKILFANLTSSRKDNRTDPPTYVPSTWLDVKFVGDAFEPAKALGKDKDKVDKIDVIKGAITNEKDPVSGRWFLHLTVFEFVMSEFSNDADEDFSSINGDAPFPTEHVAG